MELKTLPMQTRAMRAEVDLPAMATRAEGDDRIPLSLSSDAPVERWFGKEILDHTAEGHTGPRLREARHQAATHTRPEPVGCAGSQLSLQSRPGAHVHEPTNLSPGKGAR